MVSLKAPQLKVGRFIDFLKSKEFISVAAAIIVTPFALRGVEQLVTRFGVLQQNFTVAMILAAFVLFFIAGMTSGYIRAIFLGLAAGTAVTAVAPFFEGSLNRAFGAIGGK